VLARRGKKPSANQLAFASRWLDHLQTLHQQLRAGTWVPRRTVSFVVKHPKTREIHAPDFADRVVHHLLVPRLERLWESVFIHDSYANRAGKGSHAAVDRLQSFMRQRNGKGWFLQLDVHNFFNSIHRPTLYAQLKQRIVKCTGPKLPTQHAVALQSLCHKLLAHPVQETVRNPLAAQQVPPHKRLCNAQPGCGLPIGNLTSQFFANVYLNALDQFVKHQLKVRHYVRYVDDFVLLADSAQQLQDWQAQIEEFLAMQLRLRVKADALLLPLDKGVDFLGYEVWATHRRVRRRVVVHCKGKLSAWAQRHVRVHDGEALRIRATPEALAHLQHLLASYWGHFAHARSVRLRHALVLRFAWLRALFHINPAGDLSPRWVLQGSTLAQQVAWLREQWPHAQCSVQKGCQTLRFAPLQTPDGSRVHAVQTGWLRHGTRRREITQFYFLTEKQA
jgi:RNA-directed DNA polymerase